MISQTFRRDYDRMVSEGVRFEPEDIVRLNALALKVKLSAKAFALAHLPRAVFLDNGGLFQKPLVLREPTLAHEIWIERAGEYLDLCDNRIFRFVHAYALSRKARFLHSHENRARVVKAVFSFARRRLARITSSQLADAVDYVLFGPDWMAGELPPPRKNSNIASRQDDSRHSPALGVMIGAVARRIPLSLADLSSLTAQTVSEIVSRTRAFDGDFDADAEMNAARADYVRAREEVRRRSSQPKIATASNIDPVRVPASNTPSAHFGSLDATPRGSQSQPLQQLDDASKSIGDTVITER